MNSLPRRQHGLVLPVFISETDTFLRRIICKALRQPFIREIKRNKYDDYAEYNANYSADFSYFAFEVNL